MLGLAYEISKSSIFNSLNIPNKLVPNGNYIRFEPMIIFPPYLVKLYLAFYE